MNQSRSFKKNEWIIGSMLQTKTPPEISLQLYYFSPFCGDSIAIEIQQAAAREKYKQKPEKVQYD